MTTAKRRISSQKVFMREAGYLCASEAARIVGRDLASIHRWATAGKLRYQRSGRVLYVEVASLAAMHEGNAVILDRIRRAVGDGPEAAA